MSILTSPEMFINIKKVPPPTSREYKDFFKAETEKIKNGITINGVRIGGWLYWHLNHWLIEDDALVEGQINSDREKKRPDLRENEWIIGEGMDKAEINKRGLLILGARQISKSETGASSMARRSICFRNTQNIVAGLSAPDLTMLTNKIRRGFINCTPFYRPNLPIKEWKSHVVLGYKDTAGELYTYSELFIRNIAKGNSTENLAGPTTSALHLDEIGKGDFLEALITAKPAMESKFGWRCSPIFTGTSGEFEKSEDLQSFYSRLDIYKFDCVEMLDHHNKKIKFIPGMYSTKADRKTIRLSTYLKKPKGSELDIIPIQVVRDVNVEISKIEKDIKDLEEINQPVLAKKEKMYRPITEEDLFLTEDLDNPFTDIREICKNHLAYLEMTDVEEEYGFMQRDSDTGKPKFVPSNKRPIASFPTEDHEDKDAPIIIWNHPVPGGQFGVLQVSGMDVYNTDQSYYSPSLGTLYIYRRIYDPVNGVGQDSIVASYAARPKSINVWQEQCRLLLEYYGATCLPENADTSFIRYMDNKNLGRYIEEGLDLAKEISPDTKVKMRKGLAPTVPNQKFGNGLIKNYCDEDIIVGQTPDGEPIVKKGVVRIKDKMLLKEIIKYTAGLNVDRIVAFRLALTLANSKDKYFPVAKVNSTERKKEEPVIHSPFLLNRNNRPFGNMKRNPFPRRRI